MKNTPSSPVPLATVILIAAGSSLICSITTYVLATHSMKNGEFGQIQCDGITIVGEKSTCKLRPGVFIIKAKNSGECINLGIGETEGNEHFNGLYLYDETGTGRLDVGVASLTNTKVGGTETTPASSITGFDQKGNVLYKLPGFMAIDHSTTPDP